MDVLRVCVCPSACVCARLCQRACSSASAGITGEGSQPVSPPPPTPEGTGRSRCSTLWAACPPAPRCVLVSCLVLSRLSRRPCATTSRQGFGNRKTVRVPQVGLLGNRVEVLVFIVCVRVCDAVFLCSHFGFRLRVLRRHGRRLPRAQRRAWLGRPSTRESRTKVGHAAAFVWRPCSECPRPQGGSSSWARLRAPTTTAVKAPVVRGRCLLSGRRHWRRMH